MVNWVESISTACYGALFICGIFVEVKAETLEDFFEVFLNFYF